MSRAIAIAQSAINTQDITITNVDDAFFIAAPQDVSVSGTTSINRASTAFNVIGVQIASTSQPSAIKNAKISFGNSDYFNQGAKGFYFNKFIGTHTASNPVIDPKILVVSDVTINDNGYSYFNNTEGINLQSTQFVKLIGNNINFSGAHTATGINIDGSNEIRVRDNTIGQTNSSTGYTGIILADTKKARFCCNKTDLATEYNIRAYGNNISYWRNTEIKNVFSCDKATSLNQTSAQIDGKNQWFGTAGGALHGGIGQAYIDFSKFEIDHPYNADAEWARGDIYPPLMNTTDDWFQHKIPAIAGNPNCSLDPECSGYTNRGAERVSAEDELVAIHHILPTEYGQTADWIMSTRLYNRILEHPNLKDESGILNNFFEEMQNTNIPAFNAIEQGIANLNILSEEENIPLNNHNNWRNTYMERIERYYESMNQANEVEPQSLLTAQQELYKSQLRYDDVMQEVYNRRLLRIDSLKTINNAINPTSEWEQNQKTVNSIYLNTLFRKGTVEEREANILLPIANQCLYSGGSAVLLARSLYSTWNRNMQWQPNQFCSNVTPPSIAEGLIKKGDNNQENILIYPNPAQSELNIKLPNEKLPKLSLRIVNTTGNEIVNQNLSADSNILDISMLQNGIYFCIFSTTDKVVETKRLVILK